MASYSGGPAGYWSDQDPRAIYNNGQSYQVPSASNGSHSQFATPGQGQYWNTQAQYVQGRPSSQPPVNRYHVPTTATHAQAPPPPPIHSQPAPPLQTQQPQPQFVNPSQLFQQPIQTHHPLPQYHSPQQIFQPRNPASNTPARMAPVQNANALIDQPNLLMSLAEEFFDAAHELAPSVALSMTTTSVHAYGKLIATGLGCLDAALKSVKLAPRLEANIRLRYAGVLYEETENFMEAETALSKGIALCDRNHYYDIKYAMQFLLAQFMFKKNPKAAMKALDGHISDATAYQHYSWVYALRFLRASYSVESGNPTESYAAIQNLRSIAALSSQQNDRAIYLAVSLMEAMTHLKSNGSESMEQAQRAIAAAWTYQLDPSTGRIPQLIGLAHILDVVCSIRQGNPTIMMNKLKDMQAMMDTALKQPIWDDIIAIPINRTRNSSQVVSPDTRMIIGIGNDGRDNLMMSFLNKIDASSITYLLSGIALMHKNSTDQKASRYLDAGLTTLEENIRTYQGTTGLLPDCVSKLQWRGQILCYFYTYMAFCAAEIVDWPAMKKYMDKLRSTAKNLDIKLAGPLQFVSLYLAGVYHQGIGDLDAALHIFQDTKFDLSHFNGANLNSPNQVMRDISILAALNILWILQEADRQDPCANTILIAKMEEICVSHPDKGIQTAFNLAAATVTVNPPAPLHTIKNHLGAALAGAKATANTQFLCFTLNVMCSKFFANVIGEQAEKSALAASMQAKKSGNALWRSVAEGMLAQYYDLNGKKEEASKTLEQAQVLAKKALPGS